MPEATGEAHKVVYADGIYLARNVCVLIACSDEHVLAWRLCWAETARARKALMAYVAPPEMVVTDGGSGFAKACREVWPETRVQRCVFHAFCQVKRYYTTSRPNLQAGVEPCALAKELLHLEKLAQAQWWRERFVQWCGFWCDFLEGRSTVEGGPVHTHERLRKARSGLVTPSHRGALFTYLDPALSAERPLPAANNRIEGGVSAPLRSMLRNRRGMPVTRKIRAVFWRRYMKTEYRLPAAQILAQMPTDARALRAVRRRGQARRRDSSMGRRARLERVPPRDGLPLRCQLASRYTFCPITRHLINSGAYGLLFFVWYRLGVWK